jgi:hypothetical protein
VLAGTMLNFTISLPAYFAALVMIWLWPVLWNIVGYFCAFLWAGKNWSVSGIAEGLIGMLVYVLQILSPLLALKFLEKTPIGSAVSGTIRSVTNAAKFKSRSKE